MILINILIAMLIAVILFVSAGYGGINGYYAVCDDGSRIKTIAFTILGVIIGAILFPVSLFLLLSDV